MLEIGDRIRIIKGSQELVGLETTILGLEKYRNTNWYFVHVVIDGVDLLFVNDEVEPVRNAA